MRKTLKNETLHHILLENMMEKSSQDYRTRSLALVVAENGFESEFLAEGIIKNISKDILQFLIAGAAEYGLDLATLGAAGAGPAEAAAVIIDALFAIDEVVETVKTVKEIIDGAGGYFQEAMKDGEAGLGNLEELYSAIKVIVQKGVKAEMAKSSADKVVASIKDKVGELIGELVNAVIAGIKTLIPDAAIGIAVSTAMRAAAVALSDNAFTLFKTAVGAAGDLASFITNPKVAPKFFENALKSLSKACDDMKKKIEGTSWLKVVGAVAVTGGAASGLAALKAEGGTALNKAKEIIDEKTPIIVKLIETLVKFIMPAIAVALAIYQIMMKGEYKEETTEENPKEETRKNPKEQTRENPGEKTEEASREEVPKERYFPLGTLMSEYSYKRNKEKNIVLYEWAVTGKKNYKAY